MRKWKGKVNTRFSSVVANVNNFKYLVCGSSGILQEFFQSRNVLTNNIWSQHSLLHIRDVSFGLLSGNWSLFKSNLKDLYYNAGLQFLFNIKILLFMSTNANNESHLFGNFIGENDNGNKTRRMNIFCANIVYR